MEISTHWCLDVCMCVRMMCAVLLVQFGDRHKNCVCDLSTACLDFGANAQHVQTELIARSSTDCAMI